MAYGGYDNYDPWAMKAPKFDDFTIAGTLTGRVEVPPVKTKGITPNRAILLYHLRVNPDNVKQITGSLKASAEAMCAVGLGCDAFQIPITREEKERLGFNAAEYDPYAELAKKLDVPTSVVNQMYRLNDQNELTFAQVARVMEVWFNSDQTSTLIYTWKSIKDTEVTD